MPYISTEEVATKRNELKKAFPGYKFSITRVHSSSLVVAILAAPVMFVQSANNDVSFYHLKNREPSEAKEALIKMFAIAHNGQRIINADSDYGDWPNFYVNVSIGQWNKPFVYTGK